MYPQSMFGAKKEKYQKFSAENFQFLKLKNLCILHGQVFVSLVLGQLLKCAVQLNFSEKKKSLFEMVLLIFQVRVQV